MNSSSPKRVNFINKITIMRKEEEPKEGGIIEPNAIKKNNHSTIDMKEKEGEGKSRDIRRDDPDNRTRGDTKGVDKVDEESEESEKEVKEEEEEEEDNPKYFDTFPTLKELGYHEWLLKNPRLPWVNLSAKAVLRCEAWPPRYETDQGVDSRRGER
ncbi:hypothetical protein Tco_1305593 [Tanacetum coccineum]